MDIQADDLILFTYVMEAGSFARAAERVGLPKAALSRRITALEQRLGERLLMRSTRWLVITGFGVEVLERARRLRDEMEGVAALGASQIGPLRGRLRVSMPPGAFSEKTLTPVLMSFASQHPQVQLELDVSARPVDLLREKFDLALRVSWKLPDDSTLVARPLCKVPVGLYASPDYLARRGTPTTPQALEHHACVQFLIRDNEGVPWQLERGKEVWCHTPTGSASTNSVAMIHSAALEGLGIAPLPQDLVADSETQGTLVRVLPDWIHAAPTVWAVMPGRHLVPGRTRALLNMLVAALQEPHPEGAEDLP